MEKVRISPAVVIIPLGLGLIAAVGLAAAALAARVGQVTVALKNPPSGANKWQMQVIDWDITKILSWGVDARDNIDEVATFEIPVDWKFPLRIDLGVYYQWQEDEEWHGRQLYRAQSSRPYRWDFDKMEWSDIPDPDYREIFIPDYGSYYFNVATEQFEKI
ncbi:hypothetical protein ES703_96096 [subsurface metagenome]